MSPRNPSGNCYHHTKNLRRQDTHLQDFIGQNGMLRLLSFLDLGPYHDPEGQHISRVSDMREFTELMRRLTIPYYEEARRYWSKAEENNYFDGMNEVGIYMPDTLKGIIEQYGPI